MLASVQPQLTPDGFSVLSEMSPSAQRPRVLLDAWRAGRIPAQDMPELIAFAWLHDDSPTSDISEADWLETFAATGFFSWPAAAQSMASAPETYALIT
jgi:hypothetical protein